MQIRERGNKTVCIKTTYDTIAKRTFGHTVFSQSKYLDKPAHNAGEKLTPEEVEELREWLSEREKRRNHEQAINSVKIAESWIRDAVRALQEYEEAKTVLTEEKADSLFEAISELRKELKRAGYTSPRQKKLQKASQKPSDERQADLPMDTH